MRPIFKAFRGAVDPGYQLREVAAKHWPWSRCRACGYGYGEHVYACAHCGSGDVLTLSYWHAPYQFQERLDAVTP